MVLDTRTSHMPLCSFSVLYSVSRCEIVNQWSNIKKGWKGGFPLSCSRTIDGSLGTLWNLVPPWDHY